MSCTDSISVGGIGHVLSCKHTALMTRVNTPLWRVNTCQQKIWNMHSNNEVQTRLICRLARQLTYDVLTRHTSDQNQNSQILIRRKSASDRCGGHLLLFSVLILYILKYFTVFRYYCKFYSHSLVLRYYCSFSNHYRLSMQVLLYSDKVIN